MTEAAKFTEIKHPNTVRDAAHVGNPMVSFLMPVYNAEAYLAEAIESALGQTEKNIEVVAVDDGSTDSSREILRRYALQDARMRVFEEQHRGYADALNRGLEVARGKYICRLDADDIAMPHRVEKQVKFLEEHPDHILVGGQGTSIGMSGETLGAIDCPLAHAEVAESLRSGCCFIHSAVMFRRAEVLSAGGYDPLFIPAEDYDLWVRLAAKYRLANLPDVVCRYRWHGNQVSCLRTLRQVFAVMCARAAFRGASRETIRERVQAGEKEFFRALRRLGYSNDEIAEGLTGIYLLYAASLRSTGRYEMAFKLLSEVKGHLKDLKCNSRYLAQAYSWEFLISTGARSYPRAARSLFLAFASSPRRTAKHVFERLLAPSSRGRSPVQAGPRPA